MKSKAQAKTAINFTTEEESAIFQAASRTWRYIGSDLAELGPITLSVAIETTLDAGRMVTDGKLSEGLYDRLMAIDYKALDKWMAKNRNRWF